MAESAVNLLVEKLKVLTIEEESRLRGLRDEILEIRDQLESMRALLRDADRRIDSEEPLRLWVRQVREVANDIEDILDEFVCGTHMPRNDEFACGIRLILGTISHLETSYRRRRLATRLHEMNRLLHEISERKTRYYLDMTQEETRSYDASARWPRNLETAVFEKKDAVGMNKEYELIVEWLLKEDKMLKVISVVGMGGMGKTALVSKVINHTEVRRQFECFASVSVSRTSRITELLRTIVKQLFESRREMAPDQLDTTDDGDLRELIVYYLRDKRYLVVLEDVWSIKHWEILSRVFPDSQRKSRLMVTTRNEEVANFAGKGEHIFVLKPLPDEEAMELLISRAFVNEPCPPELEPLARKMVNECRGLPLAINALGGVLFATERSSRAWYLVLHSLSTQLSDGVKFGSLYNTLLLGFYQLPYYLKYCFLYCCLFPQEHLIKRKQLIRLWVAEGFVIEREKKTTEETAEEYLEELINRSMLQAAEVNQFGRVKACRMHDLMRDVAVSLSLEQEFCLPGDVRHQLRKFRSVSIFDDDPGEMLESAGKTSSRRLRSILLFENVIPKDPNTQFFLSSLATAFQLLRVLDLSGAEIHRVPDGFSQLLNLRYLNLAGTRIRQLPKSLGRLQNLQTLDLRFTMVERLPNGIGKLQKLRHLFCGEPMDSQHTNSRYSQTSINIPPELCQIASLQSLWVIEAQGEIARLIGNLAQLRSLKIAKVRAADGVDLCAAVGKMNHLVHLEIKAIDEEEALELESFSPSPPPLLQKLQLQGKLERLPRWLGSLSRLTQLQLYHSRLREEAGHELLSILQTLPNLLVLQLREAYDGEELLFRDGGFSKLKILTLIDLKRLRRVVIGEGAMSSLQKLNLRGCGELKAFPLGIEYLATLEELLLCDMPEELDGDEERKKVARIPSIWKE